MSCLFNITTNGRHCKYCPIEICDERPYEDSVSSTTVNQLAQLLQEQVRELSTGDVPLRLNGRLIELKSVQVEKTKNDYCINVRFKYAAPVVEPSVLKDFITQKHNEQI